MFLYTSLFTLAEYFSSPVSVPQPYPAFLHSHSVSSASLPQYLQRRQQENTQRQSRGEPPLPEEDINKMFKPPQPPPRMDTLLIAGTHVLTHTALLAPEALSHRPPLLPSQELRLCFAIISIIIWKLHSFNFIDSVANSNCPFCCCFKLFASPPLSTTRS